MLDRRLLLLGLPVGALAVYLVPGLISSSAVEFTRAAPPAPAAIELRTAVSTVFVELPIDLGRVAARFDEAVAQRLAAPPEPAATDPQCARRPAPAECTAARSEGRITKAGRTSATVDTVGVRLMVPVTLEESADTAGRQGEPASLSFAFAVRHADATGFEILRHDDAAQPSAGLSPAQLRMLRQWEGRLRPVATIAHDELRRVLGELPVSQATTETWTALSEPIELGKGSGTFLRAVPELVGNGRLVATDGQPRFRIPVAARLSIEDGMSAARPTKRPPIHGQILTNSGAGIRLAMPLQLAGLQQAFATSLVRGGALDMQAERFGPPVKAVVHKVRAYPSVRQIAFELDVAATRFEGQTYRGKAHLVARPQLDATARTVTLADIALTQAPARDAKSSNAQLNAPRLSSEPLAAKLIELGGFDVSRDLTESLPRINGQLHQPIATNLSLSARLERAEPVAVETSQAGAFLVSELHGTLTFTYSPASTVATATPQRPVPTASTQVPTSAVSAAVVTAGAVAGGALAARAIQAPVTPLASPVAPANTSPTAAGAAPSGPPPRPIATPVAAPSPITAAPPATAPTGRQQGQPTVKTKVLPARPKPNSAKVANKGSWVPW